LGSSALATVRARTLFAPLDAGGRAETVARRLAQAITLGLLLDGGTAADGGSGLEAVALLPRRDG